MMADRGCCCGCCDVVATTTHRKIPWVKKRLNPDPFWPDPDFYGRICTLPGRIRIFLAEFVPFLAGSGILWPNLYPFWQDPEFSGRICTLSGRIRNFLAEFVPFLAGSGFFWPNLYPFWPDTEFSGRTFSAGSITEYSNCPSFDIYINFFATIVIQVSYKPNEILYQIY